MSKLKSKAFLLVFLPGLLLLTWTLVKFLSTGEVVTTSNLAANIGKKYGILQSWLVLRNLGYLGFIGYLIISSGKMIIKRNSQPLGKQLLKIFLLTLGGMVFFTLTYLFTALIYDFYSIVWVLINNPSAIYQ